MLYICIPAYDEAATIGVLLWRIRKIFEEYSREYEVVVYDDGSTDGTGEGLERYRKALPLTVIGGPIHRGYAHAVNALLREASTRTRYPRRDAVVLMQADFTDQPEHLPELVKRFEGGADIVVVERTFEDYPPGPQRTLRRLANWIVRPFLRVPGVADPYSSFRLLRVSVVRDLLKSLGERPVIEHEGWPGNVELLLRTIRLARRVETVALPARHDLRPRESRIRPWYEARELFSFARQSRRNAETAGSS